MKTYKVRIEGTAGLLQNKPPKLDGPVAKRGEGNDSEQMLESKLYRLDKTIYQPAIHIEQALIKAGTGIKLKGAGKKSCKDLFKGAVFIKPDYIPHKYQTWEPNVCSVVIPSTKGRIMRYRPMLKKWALEFEIEVLDDRLEMATLKLALDEAGRTIGIGDYRPRYGRFIVSEFKEK